MAPSALIPKLIPKMLIFAGMVLAAAACSSGDTGSGSSVAAEGVEQLDGAPVRDVPSALASMTADGLPEPLVDPSEVRSGGPPPDGIPPIDDPKFLAVDEVDFLSEEEPVLSLEVAGETRAYPIQIMIWHEIVNDTLGSGQERVPVTVTYCPLCNSGIAFDRTLDGEVFDFGTSGKLYKSALVMYDRQTESLWSQFDGNAIAGVLTGSALEMLPVSTVSWADWSKANPEGLVLSRDTGETRPYGQNPYPGYDDIDSSPFAFDGEIDDRLEAKERVLGVGIGSDPVAIVLSALMDQGVVEFGLDSSRVVAWVLPGTTSALEDSEIAEGRDVGATGVFESVLDGQELTFARTTQGFIDNETGSAWNVLGTATAGPLAGSQLEPIEHVDTFWFAWAAFAPETRVL